VATPGVDFFRVDRSGPTKRLLAIAGTLVLVGSSSVGAHLMSRFTPRVGHLISLCGGLLLLGGLVLGFGTMAMILFENVYLLIREDGVVLHENGSETVIAWADLEGTRLDAAQKGFILFERRAADAVRWFAGGAAQVITDNVMEARRKALHGLLKSDPPPATS
jgi:hypothetical protein